MKRLAFVAAVLAVVAACSKSESANKDTTLPAMAPAPSAATDTGMKMDSSKMMMDTTKKDTTKKKP